MAVIVSGQFVQLVENRAGDEGELFDAGQCIEAMQHAVIPAHVNARRAVGDAGREGRVSSVPFQPVAVVDEVTWPCDHGWA